MNIKTMMVVITCLAAEGLVAAVPGIYFVILMPLTFASNHNAVLVKRSEADTEGALGGYSVFMKYDDEKNAAKRSDADIEGALGGYSVFMKYGDEETRNERV